MKARAAASIVLSVGLAGGLAGCNLLSPQATTKHYVASDGVSGNFGNGIAVRNAFLVDGGNGAANLVATFVSPDVLGGTVTVQPNADAALTQSVALTGGSQVTVIGPTTTVTFSGLDAQPGSLVPLYFQSSGGEGVTLDVPVLTNEIGAYATLAPSAAAQ
ncbi:hypothetical protein [Gryllotalpicola sp.]|uniref:hypothetical protein n=1 Tax=Gryllotalpicola sp. TaxID=1932787 RepID=UPI00262B34B9|nr:hypothetical protein [Gryllotalpicola sp.]